MKRLNDQGKILGLITPLDLAIIIVIVLIGVKIIGDYRPIAPKQKERQVTIEVLIRDAPPYLAESLAVGQDLFDDATGAYMGKIRAIRSQPAQLILPGNGELRLVKSPRNLDLRLELNKQRGRIETGLSGSGVYLGKIAARVGNPVRAHTRYTAINGEIIFVRTVKP